MSAEVAYISGTGRMHPNEELEWGIDLADEIETGERDTSVTWTVLPASAAIGLEIVWSEGSLDDAKRAFAKLRIAPAERASTRWNPPGAEVAVVVDVSTTLRKYTRTLPILVMRDVAE